MLSSGWKDSNLRCHNQKSTALRLCYCCWDADLNDNFWIKIKNKSREVAGKIGTLDLSISSQVLYHHATSAGLNGSFWVQIKKYAEQWLAGFKPPISQSLVKYLTTMLLPPTWMTIFEYKLSNMLTGLIRLNDEMMLSSLTAANSLTALSRRIHFLELTHSGERPRAWTTKLFTAVIHSVPW